MPKLIDTKVEQLFTGNVKPQRDGVEIDKGVILTKDYIEKNKEHIEDVVTY
jgi:hypothetical protein